MVVLGVAVAAAIGTGVVVASLPTSDSGPATQNAQSTGSTAAPTDAATLGPVASATPVDGSEVLRPTNDEPLNRIPPREPALPTLDGPLPAAGSAQGRLVAGFPVAVVGPAEGDEVIDSSVAPEGTTLQVTLTARSERDAEAIRDHYRALWVPFGLTPQTHSTDELSFRSATASVTLDVVGTGTGTVYTVVATLRAG
jgi:septal ring-binding cell division protein DamX